MDKRFKVTAYADVVQIDVLTPATANRLAVEIDLAANDLRDRLAEMPPPDRNTRAHAKEGLRLLRELADALKAAML